MSGAGGCGSPSGRSDRAAWQPALGLSKSGCMICAVRPHLRRGLSPAAVVQKHSTGASTRHDVKC